MYNMPGPALSNALLYAISAATRLGDVGVLTSAVIPAALAHSWGRGMDDGAATQTIQDISGWQHTSLTPWAATLIARILTPRGPGALVTEAGAEITNAYDLARMISAHNAESTYFKREASRLARAHQIPEGPEGWRPETTWR